MTRIEVGILVIFLDFLHLLFWNITNSWYKKISGKLHQKFGHRKRCYPCIIAFEAGQGMLSLFLCNMKEENFN